MKIICSFHTRTISQMNEKIQMSMFSVDTSLIHLRKDNNDPLLKYDNHKASDEFRNN